VQLAGSQAARRATVRSFLVGVAEGVAVVAFVELVAWWVRLIVRGELDRQRSGWPSRERSEPGLTLPRNNSAATPPRPEGKGEAAECGPGSHT
jgi:hypothetical protein